MFAQTNFIEIEYSWRNLETQVELISSPVTSPGRYGTEIFGTKALNNTMLVVASLRKSLECPQFSILSIPSPNMMSSNFQTSEFPSH